MPPPKRRTQGGSRQTAATPPSGSPRQVSADPTKSMASAQRKRSRSLLPPTAAPSCHSRRTTPRRHAGGFRPTSHKWIGLALLLSGVVVLVLNDLMLLQPSLLLLPGGHSELYLLVAVAIAGYSTWFFGWFDRS